MPELDEQLAHYVDALTAPVTANEARLRVPSPAPARRVRRTVITALLAAACVAGALLFASTRATSSSRVNVGGTPKSAPTPAIPPASAHSSAHVGQPVYIAPSYVPAGYTLVRAQGGDAPGSGDTAGSAEWTKTQTWMKFDAAHDEALASLQINRGPRVIHDPTSPLANLDLLAGDRRQPGAVPAAVRQTTGTYLARIGSLSWEEPPGQRVAVDCSTCSVATLERIAAELRLQPNGDLDWPAPHDGFELESTAPGMASLGTNVRVVAYGNGHGRGFSVVVADDTQEPPLAQAFGGDTKIVNLRGTQGVTGSRINGPSFGARPDMAFATDPTLTVEWLEYPNVEVAVGGAGLTEQQLLQIAAGVHEVGAAQWAELGGSPDLTNVGTAPDATTGAAITHAFDAWLDGAHPDAQWPSIEDADAIRPAIMAARAVNGAAQNYRGSVDGITMLDSTSASVKYSILNGTTTVLSKTGIAINDAGVWKVSRATVCEQISSAASCPPR